MHGGVLNPTYVKGLGILPGDSPELHGECRLSSVKAVVHTHTSMPAGHTYTVCTRSVLCSWGLTRIDLWRPSGLWIAQRVIALGFNVVARCWATNPSITRSTARIPLRANAGQTTGTCG